MKMTADSARLVEVLRDNLKLRDQIAQLQRAIDAPPGGGPRRALNFEQGIRARVKSIMQDPCRRAE